MTRPPRAGDAQATRILHVEDEEMNRRLLRAVLDRAADPRLRAGVLDEAADLDTARRMLTANLPDVVLLDVRLPDGSGLDLLREIRRLDQPPRVVVMSASVLASEREEAVRAGCDAFVGKPYRPGELTALLGRLLFERGGPG